MDRETLTRSLKALAGELEALRREEFSAGLGLLAARSSLDQELSYGAAVDPDAVGHFRQSVAAANGRKAALASVRKRLETVGKALETDSAALTAERAAYAHALRTIVAIERAPAAQPSPIPPAVPAGSTPETESVPDGLEITADTLLSVAGKIILGARREAKADGSEKPDRYQERLESALAAFLDIVGDKPLRQYLPLDMQTFATVLGRVPKNRTKYADFEGLSLREMADANDRRKNPVQRLAQPSIQSMVSEVANLWTRATAGVDGVKDLKAFKVMMPSAAPKSVAREGLPVTSLNAWLADAAGRIRKPHHKWLPLLGMVTGMRLGEMVWLQVGDFAELEGHTVIDLRLPLVIGGKRVERELKTETSPRIVALHPILTELGFLEYVRSRRRGWVFPAFHDAHDPNDAAGKQMANQMERLGIRVYQKGVFHSLRHNAKAWMRPKLGDTIADRQCGHAPATVGAGYGFQVLQAEEIEQIEALPLPRGVDFSPYRKS